MSLITRCPACGTMFKVVSDQLKVSDGWVRCGQCADVFNAQLHLQSSIKFVPDPDLAQVSSAQELSSFHTSGDLNAIAAVEDSVADCHANEVVSGNTDGIVSTTVLTGAASGDQHALADPLDRIPFASAHDLTEATLEDVSFVRNARRQAFWRRPLLRVMLMLFALALGCLLAMQVALRQPSTLLAIAPGLKPSLQQLCLHFACDIGLEKQIEAIVIDSSSFSKANSTDGFRLSFTLKNTADVEIAMPFLEVTLTDTQDQPLVRRVLSPAQFGAAGNMLAAKSDFSNALTLQIQPDSPFERIAGYRLLAFYP